jgi:tRNA (cytidine/uridine-2'-O-)-methyltransferase
MLEIILYQPEIPPNTGNVMRLAANTGCRLHLVRPLGFSLSDKQLERAGLDYRESIDYSVHDDWASCRRALGERRIFAVTTHGDTRYDRIDYRAGDALLFGAETRGLPDSVRNEATARIRLPMIQDSRSLNLSNAVAVVVYEAWRQLGFANGK